MSWLSIELSTRRRELAQIEDVLFGLGAAAITLLADDHEDNVDLLEPAPGATPVWDVIRLQALFALSTDLAAVRRGLDQARVESVEIGFLQDSDWHASMRQHAVQAEYAQRLRLLPKAHAGAQQKAGMVDMFLDPGLAFGTGGHATTDMCLQSVALLAGAGMQVLDFGCGSGILGIAAALLGARVVCVDHDEQALLATRENALYNGLNSKVDENAVSVLGLAQWRGRQDVNYYDLVLANILADPLIELAVPLQSALKPTGTLILSGILPDQVDRVAAQYSAIHFELPLEASGWIRLTGRARGG